MGDLFLELDRISDELTTPGPFGGERTVHISITESRTRALDFDNSDSRYRFQVTIRQRGGKCFVGYGSTRTAAILDVVEKYREG